MMILLGWTLVVGCAPEPEPELLALGEAVSAWEEAEAALTRGDAAEAGRHLDRALAARPGDPLLVAWRARAQAEAGDVDGALARLDALLAQRPAFVEARYHRAVYRARRGRLDEAAEDLRLTIAGEGVTPRAVVRDPAFAEHLEHPALAWLPERSFEATLAAPTDRAFQGSEVAITLRVVGASAEPLSIAPETAVSGPVELVRIDEAWTRREDGDGVHTLTWTVVVRGPGTVAVEPITVSQGSLSARTEGLSLEASAPPGAEGGASARLDLPVLSAWVARHPPPATWTEDGITWVALRPGLRLTVDGRPRPPDRRAYLTEDGEPVADLYGFEGTVGTVEAFDRDLVVWRHPEVPPATPPKR